MKIKHLPILMLSMSRWDQGFSSASISIAKELALTNRVFYFDHPVSVFEFIRDFKSDKIKRRWKALLFGFNRYSCVQTDDPNLIVVVPLLTLPVNILPKGRLYNFFSRINNALYSIAVRGVLRDYSIQNYIYWNSYNPFFRAYFPAKKLPALTIYQSRDNIEESNYVRKHGPYLERIAAAKADLCMATSSHLAQKLSDGNSKFIFFPNAANVNLFLNADRYRNEEIVELKGVAGKIIGYTGNICLRQDYDLLYKIATHFKEYKLVFVGPRNDAGYHHYNFEELPNVIFTGGKNINELPGYLSKMDVTIIPFKVNKLTESIYPLKLNEYLAAGKPVVTTAFSRDLDAFSDIVAVASNHEEFLTAIQTAIDNDPEELKIKRVERALGNSWSKRVEQFWQLAEKAYDEKRRFK